ncbi:hypothetical protein A2U01_0016094, partial [Trifolium medium]|nr:hypothetical protein [Trifolium medium]
MLVKFFEQAATVMHECSWEPTNCAQNQQDNSVSAH